MMPRFYEVIEPHKPMTRNHGVVEMDKKGKEGREINNARRETPRV